MIWGGVSRPFSLRPAWMDVCIDVFTFPFFYMFVHPSKHSQELSYFYFTLIYTCVSIYIFPSRRIDWSFSKNTPSGTYILWNYDRLGTLMGLFEWMATFHNPTPQIQLCPHPRETSIIPGPSNITHTPVPVYRSCTHHTRFKMLGNN